jgi:Ca-activated chloride channel homolog
MTGVTRPRGRGPKVLHEGPIYPCVTRIIRKRFLRLAASLILSYWGVMACGAHAQGTHAPSDTTFRTSAGEVRIAFSTTDQHNHVVANVQASDFAIVDQDLVVREFRSFARSEYAQVNIALLVDASGSVTPRFSQELANVLQIINGTNGVPEEDVSVVSFRNLKPKVVCAGNCRTVPLDTAFPAARDGELTPLYDSIVFTSDMLASAPRVASGSDNNTKIRKILVIFSDGLDTISLKSFPDAIQAALAADVAIYTVDVGSRPHASEGSRVLRSLAIKTGGRYFAIEEGSEKIIDAVLEDFRATYTVAYKLPNHVAGFHEVRILPRHDLGLQFHCRLGYYYPSETGN